MMLNKKWLVLIIIILASSLHMSSWAQNKTVAKGEVFIKFKTDQQHVEVICRFQVSQVANLIFKLNENLALHELSINNRLHDFTRSGDTIKPILTAIKTGAADVEIKYSGTAKHCYQYFFNPEGSNYAYTEIGSESGIFPQHISNKTFIKDFTITAEISKPYSIVSSQMPIKQWTANGFNYFKWQYQNKQAERILFAWGVFNEHKLNLQLADNAVEFPLHFFLNQDIVLTDQLDVQLRQSAALLQSYYAYFGNIPAANKQFIGVGFRDAPLFITENGGIFDTEIAGAAATLISGVWQLQTNHVRFTSAFNRYLFDLTVENAKRLNLINTEPENFTYILTETDSSANDTKLLKSLHSLLGDSVFVSCVNHFKKQTLDTPNDFELFKKSLYTTCNQTDKINFWLKWWESGVPLQFEVQWFIPEPDKLNCYIKHTNSDVTGSFPLQVQVSYSNALIEEFENLVLNQNHEQFCSFNTTFLPEKFILDPKNLYFTEFKYSRLPEIIFPEFPTVCNAFNAIELNTAKPENGTYTGKQVFGKIFDPRGLEGNNIEISYTVTDPKYGINTAKQTIKVAKNPEINLPTVLKIPANQITVIEPEGSFASYLWSTGSTEPQLIIDPNALMHSQTTIKLEATTADQCIVKHEIQLSFEKSKSKKTEHSQFNVFPNPTTGTLKISVMDKSLTNFDLELFNPKNQLLLSKSVNRISNMYEQLDLSKLPKGIYYLRIKTETGKKIITVELK